MGIHNLSFLKSKISRSILAALVLILNSIPHIAFAEDTSCKYGECVSSIINELEDLSGIYKAKCMPKKSMSNDELQSYYEKEGISEECWKLMTEISHLEDELQKHNNQLEAETIECNESSLPPGMDLSDLTKIEKELSCTPEKSKKIKGQCGEDMKCVLAATALGFGGYLAEKLVPKNFKPANCHLGDDGCGVQLATAFLKAVVSFFEGAWDILKSGGKYVGKKAGQFWNWVSGADDHASTMQLGLAKASEEPGVLDMLMKDFAGTMAKIFEGLVAALKEWFKTDVFCQKWSGVPHFSKCERPTDNFDCLPCKTMVTGLCSMTGTLVAEIIPAFLTGGMVTAAKNGAEAASVIAKGFKVTARAMEIMKSSRVGKLAIEASTKLDDVLKVSRALSATKAALSAALAAIKAYLHSPVRAVLKASQTVLVAVTKRGQIFLAETRTGRFIVFSANATATSAKFAGKVIIYPIDNHLTTWAYKAGERTFAKVFKLGAPRLSATGTVANAIIKADTELESAIAKLESLKLSGKAKPELILQQEEKVLEVLGTQRAGLVDDILTKEGTEFNDILSHLYPELNYGPLASKVGPSKVLEAERELFESINRMPNGPAKDLMMKRYSEHVADGVARNKIMGTNNVTSALKPHEHFSVVADAKADPVKLEALNGFIEKSRASGVEITEEFMADLEKIHATGVSKAAGIDKAKGAIMIDFLKKYPKVKKADLMYLAKKEIGVLGREEVIAAKVTTPKAPEVTVVKAPLDPKAHFNSQYGIESTREVEALGLPTTKNNRAYLELHENAGKEKVVVFSSESTILKDGNDILGRETMTAAENMYQETFMDVLRHDESGSAIWKSMSRTDGGLLSELKIPLPPKQRESLLLALQQKAIPPGKLSVTQSKLLEKLETGAIGLTSEETALLYRMFPDKTNLLVTSIDKKQAIAIKKMLDDLGSAKLSESEKYLQHKVTEFAEKNIPMDLKAEEISILDGMSTRIYSGFKSVEGAVSWESYKLVLAKRLKVAPEALDEATVGKYLGADLAKFDAEVKARFTVRMGDLGYDLSKQTGKMSGPRIQKFSDWRSMGVSKIPPDGVSASIDEAAVAARAGRSGESKGVSIYDDAISATAVSKVRAIEGSVTSPGLRKQFLTSLEKRGLSQKELIESGIYTPVPDHYLTGLGYTGPRPQYVVSEKIWSVVRKSDDIEEITKRLNSLFPYLKLSKEEARLLRSQYIALDALSPAIHAEARGALPVSLGLRKGGVLDVQGLGALNAQWNDAASLVSSLNGKADDAGFILSAARSAEVNGSTPAYKFRVDSMVKTVRDELGEGWVVQVSGDDVIFYPDRRVVTDRRLVADLEGGRRTASEFPPTGDLVPLEDITEAQVNSVVGGLDRLAKRGLNNIDYGGSSLSRSTFVRGAGAKEGHVTLFETLEKNMRKSLEADVGTKAITVDTLNNTVIGFDAMVPVQGKAVVRVVIPKDSSITNEMLLRHIESQKEAISKGLSGQAFDIKIDRI